MAIDSFAIQKVAKFDYGKKENSYCLVFGAKVLFQIRTFWFQLIAKKIKKKRRKRKLHIINILHMIWMLFWFYSYVVLEILIFTVGNLRVFFKGFIKILNLG